MHNRYSIPLPYSHSLYEEEMQVKNIRKGKPRIPLKQIMQPLKPVLKLLKKNSNNGKKNLDSSVHVPEIL